MPGLFGSEILQAQATMKRTGISSGWLTRQTASEQRGDGAEQRSASDDLSRTMAARLTLALEVAQIGVWEWDFASRKLVWDARMYEIYGIKAGTPIGSDQWRQAVHPEDMDQASGIFAHAEHDGLQGRHQFRIVHPTRGVRFIETAEQLVLDAAGRPIACIGVDQDVTEQRLAQEAILQRQAELERLTLTDPLTGVGNRRKLDEDLAREVSRVRRYGGKLSFLIADVDRFKCVNDTFGHETGDAVLHTIAHALRANVRDTDLVARYGGDEFCVVMPGTGRSDARAVAKRIQARLEQTIVPSLGRAVHASMGVAQLEDGESADSLLNRADLALLRAKKKGRNRVVSDLCNGRRSNAGRDGEGRRTAAIGEAAPCFEAQLPMEAKAWLEGGTAWFATMSACHPACPPPFN